MFTATESEVQPFGMTAGTEKNKKSRKISKIKETLSQ